MTSTTPCYRLGSIDFTLQDIKADKDGLRARLVKAKEDQRYPLCLCLTPYPSVVIVQAGQDVHLRGFPNLGHLHKLNCDHYRPDPSKSGAGQYERAIQVRPNGCVDYKLSFPLSIKVGEKTPEEEPRARSSSESKKRGVIGLLGLLHDWWARAELDHYSPALVIRRQWDLDWDNDVAPALVQEIATTAFGSRPAEQVVYIAHRPRKSKGATPVDQNGEREDAWVSFRKRLVATPDEQPQAIIVGRVDSINDARFGGRIKIVGLKDSLWLDTSGINRIRRSYPTEMAVLDRIAPQKPILLEAIDALSKGDTRHINQVKASWPGEVIGIFLVKETAKGLLQIQRTGLMATSRNFIPVDSTYELDVAHALVAERRRFMKPLRYEAGTSIPFADFILLDTPQEIYMEIYGITNDMGYETRKLQKRKEYKAAGVECWEWTPSESKIWPPFPSSKWARLS